MSGSGDSSTGQAAMTAADLQWDAPLELSAWELHAPFAGWLVAAVRPDTLVELGTHWGYSFFAFCKAMQHLGLPGRAVAVDNWVGDPHAGDYGEEVFAAVTEHVGAHYQDVAELLRMDFDQAVAQFADGSIDLLHIDGFHSRAAVTHDFQTWLPKMSHRGVILFHDVREYQPEFGVHRFWDEVRWQYPSFTVPFGHGLGLLCVGDQVSPEVLALCQTDSTVAGDGFRKVFYTKGEAVAERFALDRLTKQVAEEHAEVVRLHEEWRHLSQYAQSLEVAHNEALARLHELSTENAVLRSELDDLRAQSESLQAQLDALVASRRWAVGSVAARPVEWVRARRASG